MVREIVACVQREFPNATRPEVADEVRLRLSRLRHAWRAVSAHRTEAGYLIRDWGPSRSD